tara:strand:+ start:252 stop:524 length:273 start_codon:yes stop_codon:yes gene_type:complete
MIAKPLSLGKDLLSEPGDLDSARLVSIINTNAVAIKIVITTPGDPAEIHMAAGERLSVEKDIGDILSAELASGGAISAGTVFGSQIAFTN